MAGMNKQPLPCNKLKTTKWLLGKNLNSMSRANFLKTAYDKLKTLQINCPWSILMLPDSQIISSRVNIWGIMEPIVHLKTSKSRLWNSKKLDMYNTCRNCIYYFCLKHKRLLKQEARQKEGNFLRQVQRICKI